MITELDAITEVEQILSRHWNAICASERLEVQIAQAQPQAQSDVTVADGAILLLAVGLLLAIGWNS